MRQPATFLKARGDVQTDFGVHIDFALEAEGWKASLPDYECLTRRAVSAALERVSNDGRRVVPRSSELSVLLTDDTGIAALNSRWRGKEGPTNILSFPAVPSVSSPDVQPLGDLALSIETLQKEALAGSIPLKNHYCHLIIHGMLHLFAYDHIDDTEAAHMERLEVEALARLWIAGRRL